MRIIKKQAFNPIPSTVSSYEISLVSDVHAIALEYPAVLSRILTRVKQWFSPIAYSLHAFRTNRVSKNEKTRVDHACEHSGPVSSITTAKQSVSQETINPNDRFSITDWAPLVKASPAMRQTDFVGAAHCSHYTRSLMGYSILCVGGRRKLYAAYAQQIKPSAGTLFTFHSSNTDNPQKLLQLLRQVDMIICPVDCINHNDYLTVKAYCQVSGKPCVLLDRSATDTFAAGIRTLIQMLYGFDEMD